MWMAGFQVTDFSTFKDTGWKELSRGINLFVGQNNSGKSALLKALSFQLTDNPHRSLNAYTNSRIGKPLLRFTISVSPMEVANRTANLSDQVRFPLGDGSNHYHDLLTDILRNKDHEILLIGKYTGKNDVSPQRKSSINSLESGENITINVNIIDNKLELGKEIYSGENDNLLNFLIDDKSEAIFYFGPERVNVARYSFATEGKLRPDASNLPAVLAYLQGNRRPLFDKIEKQLIEIMPGIARLTVAPRENSFEILLWPDRNTDRQELAFSLRESGTGVGQLLAILTALSSSDQAIIVIDEINTFLHPAAAKQLMTLIRSEYGRHQYIISTHSPDIISSAVTDMVYLVRREGFESVPELIDLTTVEGARQVAGSLGFSMMDVFGHDRVIWVEGKTEELCFPYIARNLSSNGLQDLGFSAVASTEAFSQRGASKKSILEIYDAVALRLAPLLKGMAFGLDRETLSDESVQTLERRKRKLRFLPRRSLECYCLDPATITSHLKNLGETAGDEQAVTRWILENGGDAAYGARSLWRHDFRDTVWLKRVDAAKLLHDLFSFITQNRQEFRKTRDTFAIIKSIFDNDRESLKELCDFVMYLIEISERKSRP